MEYEDFQQRKLERQRLKQERLRQQRKLTVKLVIALAVLCAIAVLILVISLNREQPQETVGTTLPQTQETETQGTQTLGTETVATEPENKTVIRFVAAGDLNITDRVVEAGGPSYDYTKTFMDVMPLLAEADLTAINFEGSFIGAPYGTLNASAPPQLLSALQNMGVDLIQAANSYTIKNGVSGMYSTLQTIRGAGFETMGAYLDKADFNETGGYTVRKLQGVKVALVAFTKGMDSMALPAGSEGTVNLLYQDYATAYQKVDTDSITRILRAAEREKPDITIALVHWGSEYNDTHSKSQENIRKLLLAEGVDAIIGTHPHYVQEIDFNEETGTLVAYSLGDFISDGVKSGSEYSIVLELEITKDHDLEKTYISDYTYTPIFTVADEETLRVVRLREAIKDYEANYLGSVSKETYEKMTYALKRINERVQVKKDSE